MGFAPAGSSFKKEEPRAVPPERMWEYVRNIETGEWMRDEWNYHLPDLLMTEVRQWNFDPEQAVTVLARGLDHAWPSLHGTTLINCINQIILARPVTKDYTERPEVGALLALGKPEPGKSRSSFTTVVRRDGELTKVFMAQNFREGLLVTVGTTETLAALAVETLRPQRHVVTPVDNLVLYHVEMLRRVAEELEKQHGADDYAVRGLNQQVDGVRGALSQAFDETSANRLLAGAKHTDPLAQATPAIYAVGSLQF